MTEAPQCSTPCNYCDELSHGPVPSIRKKLESRILYEDDDFVVFPTLGCLTPGYLLVATKEHVVSMAGLPANGRRDLYKLLAKVAYVLEAEYGKKVLVYEHGDTLNHAKGGACIDHAHVHLLPFDVTLPLTPNPLGDAIPTGVDYLEAAGKLWENDTPYLYASWPYADGEGRVYNATGLPSQFMRRHACQVLGKPDEWDWAVYKELDVLRDTYDQLRPRMRAL